MEKDNNDLDKFIQDDVKTDLDVDNSQDLDNFLSDNQIEYISQDPQDAEDAVHSYTDDDLPTNNEDLNLNKATNFTDFKMNDLDFALKSYQAARRGKVFSINSDDKKEDAESKNDDALPSSLLAAKRPPLEDELPEEKKDDDMIFQDDFPEEKKDDDMIFQDDFMEQKKDDDMIFEDDFLEQKKDDDMIFPDDFLEQKKDDDMIFEDDFPEQKKDDDMIFPDDFPEEKKDEAELKSDSFDKKQKINPMTINDTSKLQDNADEQRDILKWYSGKIDEKSYEISLDNMPEFLDSDKTIKVIHVSVNSTYGWNVFFDNGIFMNLQDLKTYQTKHGKLPYNSGKIVYGNKTSQFENINRIVVYELPRYFTYKPE